MYVIMFLINMKINMLYVNIKLWYEIDDKVVFKEIKKIW